MDEDASGEVGMVVGEPVLLVRSGRPRVIRHCHRRKPQPERPKERPRHALAGGSSSLQNLASATNGSPEPGEDISCRGRRSSRRTHDPEVLGFSRKVSLSSGSILASDLLHERAADTARRLLRNSAGASSSGTLSSSGRRSGSSSSSNSAAAVEAVDRSRRARSGRSRKFSGSHSSFYNVDVEGEFEDIQEEDCLPVSSDISSDDEDLDEDDLDDDDDEEDAGNEEEGRQGRFRGASGRRRSSKSASVVSSGSSCKDSGVFSLLAGSSATGSTLSLAAGGEKSEDSGSQRQDSRRASSSSTSNVRTADKIEALLRKINEDNKRSKEEASGGDPPNGGVALKKVADKKQPDHEGGSTVDEGPDSAVTTLPVLTVRKKIVPVPETTTTTFLDAYTEVKVPYSPPPRLPSASARSPISKGSEAGDLNEEFGPMVTWETSGEGGPGKRTPVVAFNYLALSRPQPQAVGQKYHLTFKTVNADARLVSQICHAHGFHEVHSSNPDYNLMWTGVHPKPQSFKSMLPHQRVNHFPRSYELTRKDRLYQNIERLQHSKGAKHFNFVPKTFMIPSEYSEFAATHHRMRGAWIVKPVASSRGRGIFIVSHPSQVPLDEPMVVAKYIDNPLLVNGHKWDLRLYVAVTSYDPLTVYLYEEGLVRFATVRYDSSGKNLWNPCMHLCNYSINKYHSDYIKCDDPDQEDQGHKWTLSALLRHLKANGIDTVQLMQNIEEVIVKSVISVEFPVNSACKMFVPNRRNCFELYGFDILVDSEVKPWLLEVNLSPSLNCDAPIDMKIKSALICDLLNLIGLPALDPVLRRAQFNQRVQNLTQQQQGQGQQQGQTQQQGQQQQQQHGQEPGTSGPTRLPRTMTTAGAAGVPAVPHFRRTTVSAETRRFAAIRLAANSSSLSQELSKMVRNAREEHARRGGFVRIFPTSETWSLYGSILEFSSPNNQILHEHLFPDSVKGRQATLSNNGLGPVTSMGTGPRFHYGRPPQRANDTTSLRRKRSLSAAPGRPDPSQACCLDTPEGLLSPGVETGEGKPLGEHLVVSGSLQRSSSCLTMLSTSHDLLAAKPPPRPQELQQQQQQQQQGWVASGSISQSEDLYPKPTPVELRAAQYEKSLTKGHCPKKYRKGSVIGSASDKGEGHSQQQHDLLEKRRSEKRERSHVLKEKIVKMIEGGLQLSEYQSRKAFSVYLHCILQRLSDYDDSFCGGGASEASGSGPEGAAAPAPEGANGEALLSSGAKGGRSSGGGRGGSNQQIELVLKFLQKAALSLREPYFLKAPSIKLGGKDRAAIVAKELNEFLSHYRRETELFTVFKEEAGMIPRHTFEEFVAFANDTDLEDVLTLQTKIYRCAHIFLGKCLPPVAGRKNSLLRTAYGISPDRGLRDKMCTMRVNARANPPTAPQFTLPPQPPTKCLDISTTKEEKERKLRKEDPSEDQKIVRIAITMPERYT